MCVQLNEQRLVWWLLQSLPFGDKIAANEALSASKLFAAHETFFSSIFSVLFEKNMSSFFQRTSLKQLFKISR